MDSEHALKVIASIEASQGWLNMALSVPVDEYISAERKWLREALNVAIMAVSVCLEDYRLAVVDGDDDKICAAFEKVELALKISRDCTTAMTNAMLNEEVEN
jgi:hypothetical protein